jgi:hypothetical protein
MGLTEMGQTLASYVGSLDWLSGILRGNGKPHKLFDHPLKI